MLLWFFLSVITIVTGEITPSLKSETETSHFLFGSLPPSFQPSSTLPSSAPSPAALLSHSPSISTKSPNASPSISPSTMTFSPSILTGSPSIQTSSPSIQTISPSVQTNSPSIQTNSPSVQTNSPSVLTDSPSIQTNSPSVQTNSPSTQTNSPSTQTNSPSIQTNSPSVLTSSPSIQTSSPSAQTNSPSIQTNSPSVLTSSPSIQTNSPSISTNSPSVLTNSPSILTNSPSILTNSPSMLTPSPSTLTVSPSTLNPSLLTVSPSMPTYSPSLPTASPSLPTNSPFFSTSSPVIPTPSPSFPTASPISTFKPSFLPTISPIHSPSTTSPRSFAPSSFSGPTSHPSASPTPSPTYESFAPTIYPTDRPIPPPTWYPSRTPSYPSQTPTTVVDTQSPSYPSQTPTLVQDTQSPSSSPSPLPTTKPITLYPSKTSFPSKSPIPLPTTKPSLLPTSLPTKITTGFPTKRPTPLPTPKYISRFPTLKPIVTTAPSDFPSTAPTLSNTNSPTFEATTKPTVPSHPVNVLLVIADDFKPLLSSFKSPFASKMYNLNRFAKEGINFLNAHSQMTICGPSRASFLTSLRPDTLGIYGLGPNVLNKFIVATKGSKTGKEALVLPKMFKESGYRTFGLGKVFHESEFNLMDAEDVWTEPMYTVLEGLKRPRAFTKPYQGSWVDGPDVDDDFFSDGQAAQLASRLILDLSQTSETAPPWFMAVGLWKPHLPFSCPQKYFAATESRHTYVGTHHANGISGLSMSQFSMAVGSGCVEVNKYKGAPVKLAPSSTTESVLSQANQAYHATSLYMDAQFGIILQALNQSLARLDTLVVFLGDHGFHLGDHGVYCKHTNFEQATKVPLIIRPPLRDKYAKRNAESFAPVELLDLMPTLYDLAHLDLDLSLYRNLEGVSLLPIMLDPQQGQVKKYALSQYFRGTGASRLWGYSLRTTRYRFTKWAGKFEETYDYLLDQYETKQVVNATVKASFRQMYLSLNDASGVPFDFDERAAMKTTPAPSYA